MTDRERLRVLFRAWYRLDYARYWYDVLRAEPMRIEDERNLYFLDAYYDPGPDFEEEPGKTIVVRGYLIDTPPAVVSNVLLDKASRLPTANGASVNGLADYPPEYGSYLRSTSLKISRLTMNAFDLLCWRHQIINGPTTFHRAPSMLSWAKLVGGDRALEDLDWKQVPSGVHRLGLPPGNSLDLRPEAGVRVTELLARDCESPLGYSLYREAWNTRDTNQRGALVMAVAAAETALKSFIRLVAPDTTWLIENIQSPPLSRLLKDYLPTLPSLASDVDSPPSISKGVRRILHGAVEHRNKIVHGRPLELAPEELEEILDVILRLLRFLDFHSGHTWIQEQPSSVAEQHITDTRDTLSPI